MAESGVVKIHGKEYQTVALRVKTFRSSFEGHSLTTEVLFRDPDVVVMKAIIANSEGRVLATGHAEEFRKSSQINSTSALENAETSAIGRALAALGLGGTEFASADEVANAIKQQRTITPNSGAGDGMTNKQKQIIADTAVQIKDKIADNNEWGAYSLAVTIEDLEGKLYLWSLLDSKERATIKRMQEAETKGEHGKA